MELAKEAKQVRAGCPIVRTNRRFHLSTLEYSQQYAPMYRCRLEAQYQRALRALHSRVPADRLPTTKKQSGAHRVLELEVGVPSLCVGVVYKQMKLLTRFLDEYQRELVRIDAGDDDNDEGGEAEDLPLETDATAEAPADGGAAGDGEKDENEQEKAAHNEHYSLSNSADELLLEDSSGRVPLHGLNPQCFCTGVVLGVFGTLLPNGHLQVHTYAFCGLRELYVPRPLPRGSVTEPSASSRSPCYIAFVSGLSLNGTPSGTLDSAMQRSRTLLEMLVDFVCGNVGDAAMLEQSRHISRLVIGGNSIAATEEQKLKRKVKLDPSDHARLSDDKSGATVLSSAKLMRELDALLARLVSSVEVELMPGDNDMSDAFLPQQPIHPVLLPTAARHSTLRLVTNPFEFTAIVEGEVKTEKGSAQPSSSGGGGGGGDGAQGVRVFVTAGQNVNDVARETKFTTRLDAMTMILASGCACPTAPNTLFSYPFRSEDPFLFQHTPHCFVACDQPLYETRFASLAVLEAESQGYYQQEASENGKQGGQAMKCAFKDDEEEEEARGTDGVRVVCVPSFERSGTVVLVDVHSPSLATSVVDFALR